MYDAELVGGERWHPKAAYEASLGHHSITSILGNHNALGVSSQILEMIVFICPLLPLSRDASLQ
jgi:hypothetical protein